MVSSHQAPPDDLQQPLELDPGDWDARQVYLLMTGLVVPRPIAWVSTRSPKGVRNVAPHSYFNMVSAAPPHIVFSSTGEKDTLRNIRASGEFVVNLVTMDVVEEMNFTAADLPPDEDEFTWAGLRETPSARVAAPRVAQARAHLECHLVDVVAVGANFLVVAEVVHVHVDPTVWVDGRVDPVRYQPVCRLSGTAYAPIGEVFRLPRPRWAEVRVSPPGASIPRREAPGRP